MKLIPDDWETRLAILDLDLDQQKELYEWLGNIIADKEAEHIEIPIKPGREVVSRQQRGRMTYQQELICCGKRNCRCGNGGAKHGPYWYVYYWNGKSVSSRYVGKQMKEED